MSKMRLKVGQLYYCKSAYHVTFIFIISIDVARFHFIKYDNINNFIREESRLLQKARNTLSWFHLVDEIEI